MIQFGCAGNQEPCCISSPPALQGAEGHKNAAAIVVTGANHHPYLSVVDCQLGGDEAGAKVMGWKAYLLFIGKPNILSQLLA